MGLRIIINGVSGMVGEGVAMACCDSTQVDAVLVLGRRPCGLTHPKLNEILIPDFRSIEAVADQLKGYDVMLYCAGISSVGMDEQRYREITYETTLAFANSLVVINPSMSFQYISGAHTDSTEKGSSMWARVKGKTENDLMKLPFRQVLAVRPGMLHPRSNAQHVNKYYKFIAWLYPILNTLTPSFVCTLDELGNAMIAGVSKAADRAILEVKDIRALAKR